MSERFRWLILIVLLAITLPSYSAPSANPQAIDHITFVSWVRSYPIVYGDNVDQGVIPDIVTTLFGRLGTELTFTYAPGSRSVSYLGGTQLAARTFYSPDPALFERPGYLLGSEDEAMADRLFIVSEPLLTLKVAFVSRSKLFFPPSSHSELRVGALRLPHLTKAFWRDVFGLADSPIGYPGHRPAFQSLMAGRLDVYLSPLFAVRRYQQENPEAQRLFVGELTPTSIYLVFDKKHAGLIDADYLQRLNEVVKQLKHSGEIKRIAAKHMDINHLAW